jgi:hypothetical protein
MASLYSSGSGSLIAFSATLQDQGQFLPVAPEGAAATLSFDESTNAALVVDIQANWDSYALIPVNGLPQLQKNGSAVTIAAPSALYSLQSTILNGVPDAALKAAIVALWNGNATTAQQQKALAYCLLKLHQAGII